MDTVYVRLLDDGTDVWRPVDARRASDLIYEILPRSDYESLGEQWQFPPGTLVICRYETRDGHNVLIAQKKA